MKYIRVDIVETGARLFSSDYSRFNQDQKTFGDLASAQAFIRERYGKAKRQRMYCDDTKDGEAKEIGWCYRFRNADMSHAPCTPWNQCDWVTISEVEETAIAA